MLKSIIAKIQLLCNEDESCSYRRNELLLFLSPHAATATAPLLDPPIGLINLLLSGLAVLFVPSIHLIKIKKSLKIIFASIFGNVL